MPNLAHDRDADRGQAHREGLMERMRETDEMTCNSKYLILLHEKIVLFAYIGLICAVPIHTFWRKLNIDVFRNG